MKRLLAIFALIFISASSKDNLKALFDSLDPSSIREHLAFYDLYQEFPEGKKALSYALRLMSGNKQELSETPLSLPPDALNSLITLITKGSEIKIPSLTHSELALINQAAARLANRQLKGYYSKNESEVIQLAPEEVDLAKGLFFSSMNDASPMSIEEASSYEAMIDLMALQILAKLPENATPKQKIREMNQFIFHEMGFRFPPHSLYAKDVDLYTFLPSVLDSREGVCLGVSLLYLCLAQRLDLQMEAITPPGHIYVRYRDKDEIINIETTARGIHIDCEEYLGIDTPYLQVRNMREVLGLSHINEASVHLQKEDFEKAISCYKRALNYLPNDALLKELMGYTYLFLGKIEEGKTLLEQALSMPDASLFNHESLTQDFLSGKVDAEGVKTIFLPVDETRESIIKKREEIREVLTKFPEFSSGYFNLAITWLQLHRMGEALEALEKYQALQKEDAKAEYFLAALHANRLNYPKAWEHLHQLEKLLVQREKKPKALLELKRELAHRSPE